MIDFVVANRWLSHVQFVIVILAEPILEGKTSFRHFLVTWTLIPGFGGFEVFIGGWSHDFGDMVSG